MRGAEEQEDKEGDDGRGPREGGPRDQEGIGAPRVREPIAGRGVGVGARRRRRRGASDGRTRTAGRAP